MKVLRREWFEVSRADQWHIIPVGDIHIGAAACDEKLLDAVIQRIAGDDRALWVGLGDYCEFINLRDPRFDMGTLANWIGREELMDLAGAQVDRLISKLKPIASKCLGLAKGNHEDTIHRHTERDVYSDIVTHVKRDGGFDADHNLALDYYGWLSLAFYRAATRNQGSLIRVNVHHGFSNGKLAGGKALNMQRWLWTHSADVVIFGHSHNTMAQVETVEALDKGDNIVNERRVGCYSGTFLQTVNEGGPSTYSERKGYFPMPIGGCEITLKPAAHSRTDYVRVTV